MNVILDILIFAVVVAVLWVIALEIRFHSLKNIAAESRDLAADATAEGDKLWSKVFPADPPAPPAARARQRKR